MRGSRRTDLTPPITSKRTGRQDAGMLARRQAIRILAGGVTGLGWTLAGLAAAQAQEGSRSQKTVPIRRPQVAGRENDPSESKPGEEPKKEHPLDEPLRRMYACRKAMEAVRDYTATFVRREEVRGELTDYQYLYMKCRNRPLGVYFYFLKPHEGREVLYVDGAYNGQLVVHETGLKDAVAGTLYLHPTEERVMEESRYPITQAGIANLIEQIIGAMERERRYSESEVQFFTGAKVSDRTCTCIQHTHPQPRKQFQYQVARIFIDDEHGIPIRFEGYLWPRRPGEPPRLVEEYTYTRLQLNPGLTDADFDVRNPRYSFY